MDNVVAFWDPRERPQPLQPFRFGYRQTWTADPKISENCVVAVRFGAEGNQWQALVDFDGPAVRALDEKQAPKVVATCSKTADLVSAIATHNPFGAPWRAMIRFEPRGEGKGPVEFRCHLEHGGKAISETWNYVWDAPQAAEK
jgi:periplasmic glucans biosynthesis protein